MRRNRFELVQLQERHHRRNLQRHLRLCRQQLVDPGLGQQKVLPISEPFAADRLQQELELLNNKYNDQFTYCGTDSHPIYISHLPVIIEVTSLAIGSILIVCIFCALLMLAGFR